MPAATQRRLPACLRADDYEQKSRTPTTLCGREWAIMVGGDGGAIGRYGEVAFAPSCRRCLAIIDRHFPKPPPDSRLILVAQMAAGTVVDQRGFAER
jgi:hypothetical protein